MNLRFKSYVLITVLSLIAVLITGMYLELIAGVIDFNHPQVSVMANQQSRGFDDRGEGIFSSLPEKLFLLFITGRNSADSSNSTPASSIKEEYPYPAVHYLYP